MFVVQNSKPLGFRRPSLIIRDVEIRKRKTHAVHNFFILWHGFDVTAKYYDNDINSTCRAVFTIVSSEHLKTRRRNSKMHTTDDDVVSGCTSRALSRDLVAIWKFLKR